MEQEEHWECDLDDCDYCWERRQARRTEDALDRWKDERGEEE